MDDGNATLRLDDQNPWPGLAAYDEGSRRFFHGRDQDTAELLRLIRLSPFVALYGKSGLGKSSMLQAGLFPQLREARFLPVYLRLDYGEKATQPLLVQAAARLRQEIDASGADAPPFDDDEGLWAFLQRRQLPIWTADNYPLTPVLVFDQFEEVFSRGGSPEHVKALLDSVADLVGDRLPSHLVEDRSATRRLNLQSQQYRVVLSFRSDFLADVESWDKQANLPRRESLHLTSMSRQRAISAVERAGAAVLEPGIATQIVDFLLQREGGVAGAGLAEVEPVLLSLCCYQLNRRRRRPAKIDTTLLHTVGEGILKGFYDEALAGMEPRVSAFIEDNLIQGDRYRNSYPLDGALSTGALSQAEIDQLTNSRLLRVDPQGDVPRIELIHDRLVSVVRESRDARRADEQQLQARAEAEGLARAQRERERLDQTENERARVARWRNGLAVTVLMLLVAIGSMIYFMIGKTAATEEAYAKADEAARARADADSEREKALAELSKIKAAIIDQQEALSTKEAMGPSQAPVGIAAAPVVAAAEKANDATKVVLSSLETAQRQLQQPMAAPLSETPKPLNPAPSPAGVPVALAAAAAVGAGNEPVRLTRSWRLSSGGCLRGDVTVTGDAEFWIEPDGRNVVVRERFKGSGRGFEVDVADVGQSVARSNRGYYDIVTKGVWKGPGGRKFESTGTDRVYASDGLTPTRADVIRFKTICSG